MSPTSPASPAAPTASGPKMRRRCGDSEAFFHMFQAEKGILLVAYTVSVTTKTTLGEEVVRRALGHLWRKVVTLRLSLVEKKGDDYPWFADMEEEKIDFEEIPWEDVEATVEEIRRTPFDGSPGPLWKVRMASDEEKLAYKFVFAFHHAITDGSSSCRIVGHFMNLLNDVMAGREVDDDLQLTSFTDLEVGTGHVVELFKKQWEEDPAEKDKLWKEFDFLNATRNLALEAGLQKGEEIVPTTSTCKHDFTEEETEQFIRLCKLQKVSVHVAFAVAAQIAMVELLQKKDINRDVYELATQHAVNLRRYYGAGTDYSQHFGFAVGMLPAKFSLPCNSRSSFWTLCKEFKGVFASSLNNDLALKNSEYSIEKFTENPEILSEPAKSSLDFSNMGDFTDLITGDFAKSKPEKEADKLAVVTHIIRSSSIHVNFSMSLLNFHTFKGKFLFSMDTNTKYFSSESAELYKKCFVDIMKHVVSPA